MADRREGPTVSHPAAPADLYILQMPSGCFAAYAAVRQEAMSGYALALKGGGGMGRAGSDTLASVRNFSITGTPYGGVHLHLVLAAK
jgi:hypothetical protein